ncbi:unnamed protein product [Pseudo-nitzschia multistriata]|uniref:GTP cyclohydrolase II n=1 Tax=Pseudo-nitzschia multistriata TaxID=183589 RepID=A0A448YYD7_9STRA|nr:unnamed protein product [Pseudo-nitzschia multistriata]
MNNNKNTHRRFQLACLAFSLVVTFCTAEALVPNPAFFSVRGGESRAAPKNADRQRKNFKFGSTTLNMDDEALDNGTTNGAVEDCCANGDCETKTPVKQIRVTARKGLGATRMPPKRNKTNGFKQNGFASENIAATAISELCEVEDRPIPAEFVAETALPTDMGQFRLRAYRLEADQVPNEYTGREPSVIYAADKSPFGVEGELKKGVHVRIHDQCLTSEVFGSKRCDCSDQLKMALKHIAEHGGAVIYLQQEGRGIGLANKVAAYALQDVGLDTVDANLHLGFPEDCRNYGAIPSIFHDMKIGSIKLMTNNPRKVNRLKELGVKIDGTVPMVVPTTNPYNHRYIEAKHERMAHENFDHLFSDSEDDTIVGETYVTEGEGMAAHAVKQSLQESVDDENEEGCLAKDDGYCFGRQSVVDAIAAVKEGKMVVVVDDMNRENEGDLIMAADLCTPEDMAFIVRYSSGVICIAMDSHRMDELKLPQMITNNEDPKNTAFTITVDATKEHGITTGISSVDRAKTMNLLADMSTTAADFNRPGHIFPLRAVEGGVLARDGHTEAGVDLAHLAGRSRAGILCEIVSEEHPTEMMRLPEMKRFAKKHGLVLTSIVDMIQYRKDTEDI